ncbi:MAG: lipoprotein-releasing ABC transporter permease subunit [Betaproteobacteria bacterium]|nr:lipoprotein-releasing ABC transporter permease subunit [Betaproteobacteria bacterium]
MQPLPLFIGLRYTRAKRRNHFISFISLISMAGIALGIAALITVMSVMNGFQKEVKARMLGVAAHVQVMGFDDGPVKGLQDWDALRHAAAKTADVVGVAPFVEGQGLISHAGNRGVIVRGILPEEEPKVADFTKDLRPGTLEALQPGGYNIILGGALSRTLGAGIGSKVQLIIPQGLVTPAGMVPRLRTFTVTGTFNSGHFEYDANLALVHMKDAQVLYQMGDNVSGLRVKVGHLDEAPAVNRALAKTLKFDGYVTDWTRLNATYFQAVQIERRMMRLALSLIVVVAAFGLVSSLVMAVTDKQADIAILRTMGMSPAGIMKVFVVQGTIIGFLGTLLGAVLGALLAANIETIVPAIERLLGVKAISPEVYFLSSLPSDLQWNDVWTTCLISFAIAMVATIYPSLRAARLNPAEALRYE